MARGASAAWTINFSLQGVMGVRDKQRSSAGEAETREGLASVVGSSISRREFLKLAGVAGATVGLGAGLGGLLSACGGSTTTTTSAGPATTAGSTTTAGPVTTSGSTTTAGPTAGRMIKIGYPSPRTGSLALFGVSDQYCVDRWNEFAKDGIVCGDGQNHPIQIILEDTQSSSNRASQVAGDLIINQKVDLMMAAGTADTVPPVADQCEANSIPCISTNCPWQSYFNSRGGDPKVGFKWTYHFYWGMEDIIGSQIPLWKQAGTNLVYGAMWDNSADGNAYRKAWPAVLEKAGIKLVDGGSFDPGTEDFTAPISAFKKGGADICAGIMAPNDFSNFWKQAKQQGYKPKIVTIGKALLFNQVVDALGDLGTGLSTPAVWTSKWPFKSSLTGETCQQLADEFEKRTNKEWQQLIEQYANFEVAVDVLKRAKSVDDKTAILAALTVTKMTTIQGDIDFTVPFAPNTKRPNPNVYRTPVATGQWVKGTKWPHELAIVGNAGAPEIPVAGKLELLA